MRMIFFLLAAMCIFSTGAMAAGKDTTTLNACGGFSTTDLIPWRHSSGTEDCKGTGTQLLTWLGTQNLSIIGPTTATQFASSMTGFTGTGNFVRANAPVVTNFPATGSDQQLQLNNNGVVYASSGLKFNSTSGTLSIGKGGADGIAIAGGAAGIGTTITTTSSGASSPLTINSIGTGTLNLGGGALGLLNIQFAGSTYAVFGSTRVTLAPNTSSTASTKRFNFTAAADTNLTGGAEATEVLFDMSATRQHALNTAIAANRWFRISGGTDSFAGGVGNGTITDDATLSIDGGPIGGANAKITNSYGLFVSAIAYSSVTNGYGIAVNAPTGATNNYAAKLGPVKVDGSGNVTGTNNLIVTLNKQSFTASGTYTPTSGMLYAVVECVGGGGGGGGVGASITQVSGGGGGGGGSYSKVVLTAAQIGVSQTVTIGAGGTAGANTGGTGGNGADTSVGTLCVGKGGSGGVGTNTNDTDGAGGAGGVAGTGDETTVGADGGASGASNSAATAASTMAGAGGASRMGFPPGNCWKVTGAGSACGNSAAANTGAGGQGAIVTNSGTGLAGGVGGSGKVFILEFVKQ